MSIKEAVVHRLRSICRARGMTCNALAVAAGVTPSTVYSLMDARRKDVSLITLKKLCDGLDITITNFFDDDLFRFLEQELQ